MSAPLTGGYAPGADRFAVDGNFAFCDPCGPPVISYPIEGDSIFSDRDIIYFDPAAPNPNPNIAGNYRRYNLGAAPNLQPWSPNQRCILIDQEFMVAQEFYQPMRLNTPYDPAWSLGWTGTFGDGTFANNLANAILVKEGRLENCGAGISKLTRRWVTVPFTRNLVEQFPYTFIGMDQFDTGAAILSGRKPATRVTGSRVQLDYFVFDDFEILGTALFPAGNRLNSGTGLFPPGLIFQEFRVFGDNFADDARAQVSDNDPADPASIPTTPSLNLYRDFAGLDVAIAAEIIAEASVLRPWMGNIYERATRFVIAQ